jgi:hypothetical protein
MSLLSIYIHQTVAYPDPNIVKGVVIQSQQIVGFEKIQGWWVPE